ncbi:MAG: asparaginase [Pseudomonadota bacterium]
MANPILIEVTRGGRVESVHRGAISIAGIDGSTMASLGATDALIYPRSSIKALQCIPLVESGAADHFGFRHEELALACGSHVGTAQHVEMAQAMLVKLGLDENQLRCGAHTPLGGAAAKALWQSGHTPTQLHNNCSGKHVGMLATALFFGEPLDDYTSVDHPVQRRVHAVLEDVSGRAADNNAIGLDGCGVPNWPLPLDTLASVFARIVRPDTMSAARARAVRSILEACWTRPDLVAGKGRADTIVMTALPGEVFIKTGAEGVYGGGLPRLGLGFAIKVDDGTTRASAGTAIALIEALIPQTEGLIRRKLIKTWRGVPAGEIRASEELSDFISVLMSRCQ